MFELYILFFFFAQSLSLFFIFPTFLFPIVVSPIVLSCQSVCQDVNTYIFRDRVPYFSVLLSSSYTSFLLLLPLVTSWSRVRGPGSKVQGPRSSVQFQMGSNDVGYIMVQVPGSRVQGPVSGSSEENRRSLFHNEEGRRKVEKERLEVQVILSPAFAYCYLLSCLFEAKLSPPRSEVEWCLNQKFQRYI